MIGEKVLHFQKKSTDIDQLPKKIADYLESDGFAVQTSAPSSHGTVIQAKKGGFLRSVVTADRSLTIVISGNSDDFTARISIGKWIKHLDIALIETLLLSELFLFVDIAETAWNFEVEDKVVKKINEIVG